MLDQLFTINIIDCGVDDIILGNIPVVDWPPTSASLFANANTFIESQTYVWMKDGGPYEFLHNTAGSSQIYPSECGPWKYKIDYVGDPGQISLSGTAPNQKLVIDGVIAAETVINIIFSIENDWPESEVVFTDVNIHLKKCDSNAFEPYTGTTDFTFQLNVNSDTPNQWDEFLFGQFYCIVDTYVMTCDGPFLDATAQPVVHPDN